MSTTFLKHQEIAFNKEKWMITEGSDYIYRQKMLNDIIETRILKGLTREEVLALLGEPTRIDKNYLFYKVSESKIGFFTLGTKTLVLQLTQDSVVGPVMVHN